MTAILKIFSDYFEYVLAAIVIGIVLACLKITYDNGKRLGISETMIAWQAQDQKRAKEIDKYKEEIKILSDAQIKEIERNKHEVKSIKDAHVAEVNTIRASYDKRLLDANKRSAIYKRMSQDGELERDRLAEHATNLDRSLEESRLLAQEQRSAIAERDKIIGKLVDQIKAIQHFYNSIGTKNDR